MKRALVFGGGGSRGIYEIGAWKAAEEAGFAPDMVFGTSIGALNAALAAQGGAEEAHGVWKSMDGARIFRTREDREVAVTRMVSRKRDILPFLLENVQNLNIDTAPFEAFLREHIREARIRAGGIVMGCTVTSVPAIALKRVYLRDMEEGKLVDWLLASSAAFPVFPLRQIGQETYMDGGFSDNLPVGMAVESGAEEIVCVDVHPQPKHYDMSFLPNTRWIYPGSEVGGFLDFSEEALARMYRQGYCDGRRAFGLSRGFAYTFEADGGYALTALAGKYLLAVLREDELAERGARPMLTWLRRETPTRDMTNADFRMRGLEAAFTAMGMRRDAIYAESGAIALAKGYARGAARARDGEEFDRVVSSGDGLRAFYANIDGSLRFSEEARKRISGDPAAAAGALYLRCLGSA